jgi:hypothetical protein
MTTKTGGSVRVGAEEGERWRRMNIELDIDGESGGRRKYRGLEDTGYGNTGGEGGCRSPFSILYALYLHFGYLRQACVS